ncbi:TnsD family Tn7-like transposition protein [Geomonas subterranea]|uniref:TnsD family Tn7-like transposition protein n=1 Tax=Geomonas subterranea TaxID=2847989 RepID=UPI001CD4996B|nr:TnsD family Tn7-like transposition protein [Geomonas fuzhouensis]
MLPFFPRPYPNEFLYSIFARYHYRAGNLAYKHTSQELLGSATAAALTLYPSNLEHLCSQLHNDSLINADMLVENHTFFPLYRPFLSNSRRDKALSYMKGSNRGDQRRTLKGFIRFNSHIANFKYCKRCIAADRQKFGEAYWHRDHQLRGVLFCYRHRTLLTDSGLPLTSTMNKKELYLLDDDTPRVEPSYQSTQKETEHLKFIASSVHWLLNNPLSGHSAEIINLKYEEKKVEMGLAHILMPEQVKDNGALKSILCHRKVANKFNKCFSENLLAQLPESIRVAPKSNWVIGFLKDSRKETDPFRHIMITRLMGADISVMFASPEVKHEADASRP